MCLDSFCQVKRILLVDPGFLGFDGREMKFSTFPISSFYLLFFFIKKSAFEVVDDCFLTEQGGHDI